MIFQYMQLTILTLMYVSSIVLQRVRVKLGKFGHEVNLGTYLQTVKIQMRWLPMSHLIRILTVYLVKDLGQFPIQSALILTACG